MSLDPVRQQYYALSDPFLILRYIFFRILLLPNPDRPDTIGKNHEEHADHREQLSNNDLKTLVSFVPFVL